MRTKLTYSCSLGVALICRPVQAHINPARRRTIKPAYVEVVRREPASLIGSARTRFPTSRMICSTVASAAVSAVMTRSGTPGSGPAVNCSSQRS